MNKNKTYMVFKVSKEKKKNIVDALLDLAQELGVHLTVESLRIVNDHYKKIVEMMKKK